MCWFLSNRSRRAALFARAAAALGRAAPKLEQQLETFSTGQMGILIKPSADQDGPMARAELERALGADLGMRSVSYRIELDAEDYPWVVLCASTLPHLAAAAEAAGIALVSTGIGDRVIASVYPFTWKDKRIYWLYQPRIQAFTPFVPLGEAEEGERDHPLEVRMAAAMRGSIPVASDLTQWYPVWGVPV